MTLTLFLVRHAAHDDVGRLLAGRSEPVSLGETGREQARRLAERVRQEDITCVYTSPRTRTWETATVLAAACGLAPPEEHQALDEIDFGHWSGKDFETLKGDPLWRRWNTTRSLVRAPGGETMVEVQSRILNLIETLLEIEDGRRIALVSHADVIKAAVSHVLGLSLDAWPRFDVAPASVTTLAIGDWGAKVLTLNATTP